MTKFSADVFRYYFLSECPFPGDGDFTWKRFEELYKPILPTASATFTVEW